MRRTFKASNDRLAKSVYFPSVSLNSWWLTDFTRKNNELLAQISLLNRQLQESASENFKLRGELSTLQRTVNLNNAKSLAFEREKQTMLDLIDEVNRAVSAAPLILSHLMNAI